MSVSALTAALVAVPLARIGDHHSAGTLSRCHHFDTAEGFALISEAIASREGQSSISERNVLICEAMPHVIGQTVLKRKAILSLDEKLSLGHTVQMADTETETQYKQTFISRVKSARIATGMKQWQIAESLGMPQDKYKQYESRSLLPHHLIGRFCIITRIEPDWLLTGRGQKPIKPLHVAEQEEPAPVRKPKRARSSRAA
jgi:DNA-binding transcriptional regulator YiaG